MTRVRSWLVMAVALLLGAAPVSAAQAQARGSGGQRFAMRRGRFLGMLSVERVQKELKLSKDQIGKVKGIRDKLRAEIRAQLAGLQKIKDRQERRAKMTELGNRLDEKARGQIRKVLSSEQMIRLYQIRLQVRGAVYGLNNKWIAGRLKLTEEQKKKAAELEKTTPEKISEAYSGLRNLSQEERRKKYAELREKVRKIRSEADKQALGLLTAKQKETFEKLEGKRFEP